MAKKLSVPLFFMIGILSVSGVENIIWESDFSRFKSADSSDKGWVLKDLSAEIMGSMLRLRETGEETEGSMSREIKYLPSAKFIQVKAGIAEDAGNTFYLSSGGEKYKIFTGWNTFQVNQNDIKNGNLRISITQKGIPGNKPGGWADLELIRVVEKPLDGFCITLDDNGRRDNTAKIGDSVVLKYYPETSIQDEKLFAGCFVFPEMSDYRFNDTVPVLKRNSDNSFSCIIKIDEKAFAFKSGNGKKIFVSVLSSGVNSYAFIPFNIDVREFFDPNTLELRNQLPPPVFRGANPDIIKYRKMWAQYTKGNNLALGKRFIYSRTPDDFLTRKGGTDSNDLTDGILSDRKCDTIWFDSKAVGWYMSGAENGVNCLLDLGEIKPVGNVVIRALAGAAQSNLRCPREFRVFVSRDGKNFYEAASMQKLMPGEKNQSDFKRYFYIDELGKAFVYPFSLSANADARYIGITITGATGAVFTDEIAVMEASPSLRKESSFNNAYENTPQAFYTDGIIVAPRTGKLVLSSNINLPNSFFITDMRAKEYAGKKADLLIDLPETAVILDSSATKETLEIEGEKYSRWRIPLQKLGSRNQTPMLFISPGNKNVDGKTAYFSVKCEGVTPITVKAPIHVIEVPAVSPAFKKLHISLAWMFIGNALQWPDFFKAWKTLGFNSVACHPYYWKGVISEKNKNFLEEARKNGMKVVMNDSPFHVMEKGHKAGSEIFSLTPAPNTNLCPSYRGQYYVKEMERVAKNVELVKPDYVFWDIECWYRGALDAQHCSRCLDGQKKSGRNMDEYLINCGTEMAKNLYEAVEKGNRNGKMPLVGSYNRHAASPVYHKIDDFNQFYPNYVQTAMPSLYVAGRALDVHNSVRKNYELLKKKEIIPWLSAGCYGEFESYKMEQMVLEALMNGANGITYYWYGDFDTPLDFYYHAKALSEIAPYEDIIADGEILTDLNGSNKGLTYSGIKKGNEMLLLIGNYRKVPNGETELNLPFKKISEIKDLRNNNRKINSGKNLKTNISKDQIGLYYIKGTE